jgi:hypothetical protein
MTVPTTLGEVYCAKRVQSIDATRPSFQGAFARAKMMSIFDILTISAIRFPA